MRFTLSQLLKLPMPYEYTEDLDLNEDLVGLEGILKVLSCHVKGRINRIDDENYEISFHIESDLILECAISLKEVPYTVTTDCSEVFSTKESDETFTISKQTLDTKEAVITNLLLAKPMNVYAPGVSFEDENDEFEDEEKDDINPAFASLKELL